MNCQVVYKGASACALIEMRVQDPNGKYLTTRNSLSLACTVAQICNTNAKLL